MAEMVSRKYKTSWYRIILWAVALLFVASAVEVLLLAASGSAMAGPATGNLYGHAQDGDGKGLASVTLVLSNGSDRHTSRSAADGTFRFPDLEPGNYAIRAEHEDLGSTDYGSVNIRIGRTTAIDLFLDGSRCQRTAITS